MKASRNHVLSMLFGAIAAIGHMPAWAHATLQSATPAKDAEVSPAPREVILHFNEKLEAVFSSIKVIDSAGKAVTAEKAAVDASDPSMLKVAVPALAPGKYTVQFVVVGHDGHRRKGDYSFTVK